MPDPDTNFIVSKFAFTFNLCRYTEELAVVLDKLEKVRSDFNAGRSSGGGGGGGGNVSIADVIVIGGAAAVEKAAKDAGYDGDAGAVTVSPGRGDATHKTTDVAAQAVVGLCMLESS